MTRRDRHHVNDEELSLLLDNQLPAAERERVEAHLRTCSTCAESYRALRETVLLVRATPRPVPPRALTLTETDVRPATRASFWRGAARWATAFAALALVVLVGIDIGSQFRTPMASPAPEPMVMEAPQALTEKKAALTTPEPGAPAPARSRQGVVPLATAEGGGISETEKPAEKVEKTAVSPESEPGPSVAGTPIVAAGEPASGLTPVGVTTGPRWPWYRWGELGLAIVLALLLILTRPWKRA